jgi:hypothetical protein
MIAAVLDGSMLISQNGGIRAPLSSMTESKAGLDIVAARFRLGEWAQANGARRGGVGLLEPLGSPPPAHLAEKFIGKACSRTGFHAGGPRQYDAF